jgi:biotin carboxylase
LQTAALQGVTHNKAVLQSETLSLTVGVHHLFKSKIVGEKNMRLEVMMMTTMMVISVNYLHLQATKISHSPGRQYIAVL